MKIDQQCSLRLTTRLGVLELCWLWSTQFTFWWPGLLFHTRHPTLVDRQQFILQGEAWKYSQINPIDKLRVAQLEYGTGKVWSQHNRKEETTTWKDLEDLQKGISNVPAILQQTPDASLDSLNLERYEVFPTESLHDLKGHKHNTIEEATKITSGETQQILKQVKSTILNKCALWCSDFRKAAILTYQSVKQSNHPETPITELFRLQLKLQKSCMHQTPSAHPKLSWYTILHINMARYAMISLYTLPTRILSLVATSTLSHVIPLYYFGSFACVLLTLKCRSAC